MTLAWVLVGSTALLTISSLPSTSPNMVEVIRVRSASSPLPFGMGIKLPRPPSWTNVWGARTAGLTSLRVFSVTSLQKVVAFFTGRGVSMMASVNVQYPRAPSGRLRRFLVLIYPCLFTHSQACITMLLTQTPPPPPYLHPKPARHLQAKPLPLL